MRKYELVCIFHPDLDEEAFTANVDKVKAWITELGGSVDKVDIWGRRKLAYSIRKQKEGQYILLNIMFNYSLMRWQVRNNLEQ